MISSELGFRSGKPNSGWHQLSLVIGCIWWKLQIHVIDGLSNVCDRHTQGKNVWAKKTSFLPHRYLVILNGYQVTISAMSGSMIFLAKSYRFIRRNEPQNVSLEPQNSYNILVYQKNDWIQPLVPNLFLNLSWIMKQCLIFPRLFTKIDLFMISSVTNQIDPDRELNPSHLFRCHAT